MTVSNLDIGCPDGQTVVVLPMKAGQKITLHPTGPAPPRPIWDGRPATTPRSTVRVIKESLAAGGRNSPLGKLVKYADQCTIWLGKPKAEMPEQGR